MRFLSILPLGLLALGLYSSCTKKTSSAMNGANAAVAGGIGALSGAVQFGNTKSNALSIVNHREPPARQAVRELGVVTTCNKSAFSDTCSNQTRKATYTNCTSTVGTDTYTGGITLSFSDLNCNLDVNALFVVRTIDILRQRPQFSVRTSSQNHTDYRDLSIGGGVKITKSGSQSYDIDILGLRKVATDPKDSQVYDTSIRSILASVLTGVLDGDRTLDGGKMEVAHNVARYVATFTPVGLTYNLNCCYPSGGTLAVEFSGTILGTGSIAFNASCGSAVLERAGLPAETVELHGCE